MIRKLNLMELDEVCSLLDVQLLAYGVEAELIDFYDIPALKDTISSIQSSNEIFYGYFCESELCGAISYIKIGNVVDICRLIVHPNHFRQGIGRALVAKVLLSEKNVTYFTVSTGQKNWPAVQLYKQFDFIETGTTEVSSNVFVSHFEKRNN